MDIINELTKYIREQDERLLALEKRVAELEGNNRVTVKMEDIAPVKVTKPDVFKAAQEVEKTGDIFAEEKPKRTRVCDHGCKDWSQDQKNFASQCAALGFGRSQIADAMYKKFGIRRTPDAVAIKLYYIRKEAEK